MFCYVDKKYLRRNKNTFKGLCVLIFVKIDLSSIISKRENSVFYSATYYYYYYFYYGVKYTFIYKLLLDSNKIRKQTPENCTLFEQKRFIKTAMFIFMLCKNGH